MLIRFQMLSSRSKKPLNSVEDYDAGKISVWRGFSAIGFGDEHPTVMLEIPVRSFLRRVHLTSSRLIVGFEYKADARRFWD